MASRAFLERHIDQTITTVEVSSQNYERKSGDYLRCIWCDPQGARCSGKMVYRKKSRRTKATFVSAPHTLHSDGCPYKSKKANSYSKKVNYKRSRGRLSKGTASYSRLLLKDTGLGVNMGSGQILEYTCGFSTGVLIGAHKKDAVIYNSLSNVINGIQNSLIATSHVPYLVVAYNAPLPEPIENSVSQKNAFDNGGWIALTDVWQGYTNDICMHYLLHLSAKIYKMYLKKYVLGNVTSVFAINSRWTSTRIDGYPVLVSDIIYHWHAIERIRYCENGVTIDTTPIVGKFLGSAPKEDD